MSLPFAELVTATSFSFLHGASQPQDMVLRAISLGMPAIGIADRNSVAGVVRAKKALRLMREELGEGMPPFRLITGARLIFADDTPDIVVYPVNRRGWGRLTKLLSKGNLRSQKGGCTLFLTDLLNDCGDLLLIVVARDGERDGAILQQLKQACPGLVWIAATMGYGGKDKRELIRMQRLGRTLGLPLLATADALYATADDRSLHDIVTCIREGVTIPEAGRLLRANGERHLKAPDEMERLFKLCPEAVTAAAGIMNLVQFTLDDLEYHYPHEPVPDGWHPQDWLEHLVLESAYKRYGKELPEKAQRLIAEEFKLIRDCDYACYFLTVHDLVRFARSQEPPILCQGRGSAANSIVCFLLGVTSVDPMRHNLLFSRFMSAERREPPDIDIDFEHERREEVMQYIYRRYGRDRAGITATVIHYRPRSTIREVGKALGLTEDVTSRLADTIWGHWGGDVPSERLVEAGLDPDNPDINRFSHFVGKLLNFPRHLSQHVGGFVLSETPLDEIVPIHNAAMPDRTFIEWDKDDLDELGLMKVDVLALGMLTCIRKCFDLMREHGLGDKTLEVDLDSDDPAVYDMLCRGESIGVFQVESRAQINMLPRLKPREFYDLVVQVAIVRPGPIEGDMVHPYLRRRAGEEPADLPGSLKDPEELKEILGGTYGVPLFQEQAMKLAIVAADFSPEKANQLRRAMATFRNVGTITNFKAEMIDGMTARGYQRDFAERCFKQIEGFGSYGFPESHAQSFARLVYVSSWIKHYHPAIFTCGLLNSQPMGFYAPAQLVRDAQAFGVEVLPPDINASFWDSSIERKSGSLALRLGFKQIDGFCDTWADRIAEVRTVAIFDEIESFSARTALPQQALRSLAAADAFGSLGKSRRKALWEVQRIPYGQLPLFAFEKETELAEEVDAKLPVMPLVEEVVVDYQTSRLSLKGHPMQFLRQYFQEKRAMPCKSVDKARNGKVIRAAGVVITRQRPGKGNAIFITIEDETGIVNVLLWARHLERQRQAVMSSRLMLVEGEVQRSKEGVVHLMASQVMDETAALDLLSEDQRIHLEMSPSDEAVRPHVPRGHGHPRNIRILPPSRDFH